MDAIVFASYIPTKDKLYIVKEFFNVFEEQYKDTDIYVGINGTPCLEYLQYLEQMQNKLNIQYEITIPFEQAAVGVEKKIELPRHETCSECSGTGAERGSKPKTCPTCSGQGRVQQATQSFLGNVMIARTCPECGGEGEVVEKECKVCKGSGRKKNVKNTTIRIPAGVDDGDNIRFK